MNEPKRLRDGALGDEFRALVRSADDDVLDDEAVERLRGRLATVGVATSVVTVAKTATTASARALVAKLVLVAGGGVLAVAAVLHFASRAPSVPAPAVAAETQVIAVPVPIESSAPIAPVAIAAPEAQSVSITDLPRVATPARVVARPSAEPQVEAAPPPAATTTPREGLLLLRARRALPADPALALTLVHQHESEFPQSQLAPERDKIRREAEKSAH